ncbi:efflux RND transporter periplasmic adaptor subunit [Bordetella bronchialis]|uniref:Efflux transporter periplasmic adaptor subunit n=1 Tax=Bordetella bronchialis TaxID=463025 RepID=A0A193G2G5_9BORD|nr:efflux RND transporter periplasmic adaptor subunit [Bordetella bronchialis]ANN73636.1 efflux transporter periplasmic adaptor subunit [Bordetella bronchialis]
MADALSRRRAGYAAAAVALAAVAAAFWGVAHKAESADAPAPKTPPVIVTSTRVEQQDVPIYLTGVGTVTANQSVTVKTRVDGELDKVGFVEGQDVKAGQLLAQLDPRPLQAQLAQAKATQAKDQAQLLNARLDLKRFTQLTKEDAATQQQLDTQRALVAQLEATVQMDQAQVAFAQVQLDYTTITAPIGGRVGARLVDPGNIVHATDTGGLVVINQIDPISVLFTVPESAVGDINTAMADTPQGLPVTALGRESNQPLGEGRLVLVNNQIDTTTGTVQLKAVFPNPRHVLWPGQYVNARLQLGTRKQALTVPAAAVQRGQDGTYAYALDDQGVARVQPIRVAVIQDNVAVVDDGLKAGERVVVDGQYKLRPGLHTVESKTTTAMAGGPGGTPAAAPAAGAATTGDAAAAAPAKGARQ